MGKEERGGPARNSQQESRCELMREISGDGHGEERTQPVNSDGGRHRTCRPTGYGVQGQEASEPPDQVS